MRCSYGRWYSATLLSPWFLLQAWLNTKEEKKKKRHTHAFITACVGYLAAINQLITTHFSTEYSEPQPTTESILRKCPQERNHIHEGYFIPTAPAFSQLLRASSGLGMTMERGSDKGENTFFREIYGVCHFFFVCFCRQEYLKAMLPFQYSWIYLPLTWQALHSAFVQFWHHTSVVLLPAFGCHQTEFNLKTLPSCQMGR